MICYIQRLEKKYLSLKLVFFIFHLKSQFSKDYSKVYSWILKKKNCSTKAKVNVVLSFYFGIILLYMNFKEFKSLNTKLNFDRKKHNTMTEHMNWQWGIKISWRFQSIHIFIYLDFLSFFIVHNPDHNIQIEGGAMQVTIHKLSVDIYPYNTAGQLYFIIINTCFVGWNFCLALNIIFIFAYYVICFGDFNVELLFSLVTFERKTILYYCVYIVFYSWLKSVYMFPHENDLSKKKIAI